MRRIPFAIHGYTVTVDWSTRRRAAVYFVAEPAKGPCPAYITVEMCWSIQTFLPDLLAVGTLDHSEFLSRRLNLDLRNRPVARHLSVKSSPPERKPSVERLPFLMIQFVDDVFDQDTHRPIENLWKLGITYPNAYASSSPGKYITSAARMMST